MMIIHLRTSATSFRRISSRMSPFNRIIRFVPADSQEAVIGEPIDATQDVGLAMKNMETVEAELFSGSTILSPGSRTGRVARVGRLLSPLSRDEVGTIRCIGLNYHNHCKEMSLQVPKVPTVFLKPRHALADPAPTPTVIPKAFLQDDAADWESELAVVISKPCKDITESEAMQYVLGYTAANDISSRRAQFRDSQWCFSKGFDGSCPIGPTLVSAHHVGEPTQLVIEGKLNGILVQKSGLDDLIFDIPKIISFLSQGTTLDPGTIILTGTPAGVGWSSNPQTTLQDGDEFTVSISHGVGTLVNRISAGE